MQPGEIFWANVPLVRRPTVFEVHPAIVFRELDDAIIIFGGTSTPDTDFRLLATVNFGGHGYSVPRRYGMNRLTYFYDEHFQVIPFGSVKSAAYGYVELSAFDALLLGMGIPIV